MDDDLFFTRLYGFSFDRIPIYFFDTFPYFSDGCKLDHEDRSTCLQRLVEQKYDHYFDRID